jgi:recombination protein RecA
MAKSIVPVTRDKALDTLVADLQKTYGPKSLFRLGDQPARERVSTGLPELDYQLNGGLLRGSIVEIFGLKGSGKSSLACQIGGKCDRVLYLDGERSLSPDDLNRFHMTPDNTIIGYPGTLEEALEITLHFARCRADMVILDSLPSFPVAKEVDEKDFTKNTGMAHCAGLLSRKLPVLNNACFQSGTILVIVNQQRANVGAMPFAEQYHTFGGLALPSFAETRIAVARKSWLKHEKLGVLGQELVYLIDKSNHAKPRQGASLPLVFAKGFVSYQELPDIRKELITTHQEARVVEAELIQQGQQEGEG